MKSKSEISTEMHLNIFHDGFGPFSRHEAMIYLITRASYAAPTRVAKKSGEKAVAYFFDISLDTLSEIWKWTKPDVATFLGRLNALGFINYKFSENTARIFVRPNLLFSDRENRILVREDSGMLVAPACVRSNEDSLTEISDMMPLTTEQQQVKKGIKPTKTKTTPPNVESKDSHSYPPHEVAEFDDTHRKNCRANFRKMVEAWNEAVPEQQQTNDIDGSGKRAAQAHRVLTKRFGADIDQWKAFCDRVARSSFLTGRNNRGWVAKFHWVLETDHLDNVLSGKYDDTKPIQADDPFGGCAF